MQGVLDIKVQEKDYGQKQHGSDGTRHEIQIHQMCRHHRWKVRRINLQISIENNERNPSNIPEKLELRGFAAKKGINRPKLNKFKQLKMSSESINRTVYELKTEVSGLTRNSSRQAVAQTNSSVSHCYQIILKKIKSDHSIQKINLHYTIISV